VHPITGSGKPDYSRLVPCDCQKERLKQEERDWNMRYCNLPAGTERQTLANFGVGTPSLKEAFAYARQIAEGQNGIKWLTLISPVGRGKTHLAIAVARRWLERGQAVRYSFVPKMLAELRHGYDREDEYAYDAQLTMLCTMPLLLLDDLGVERPTDWAIEQLQTIINERYIAQLPLIVTTNRPLDDLRGDEEHRIGSRLRRESWCRVVVIDAPEFNQASKSARK
jgi:DNA replication protein DnaC